MWTLDPDSHRKKIFRAVYLPTKYMLIYINLILFELERTEFCLQKHECSKSSFSSAKPQIIRKLNFYLWTGGRQRDGEGQETQSAPGRHGKYIFIPF